MSQLSGDQYAFCMSLRPLLIRPEAYFSLVNKRLKGVPVLGSFHASDILNVYFGGDMADYLIRFVATLNPNGNTGISWPKWTSDSPRMLMFQDGLIPLTITQDTYRKDAMNLLNEILLKYPV